VSNDEIVRRNASDRASLMSDRLRSASGRLQMNAVHARGEPDQRFMAAEQIEIEREEVIGGPDASDVRLKQSKCPPDGGHYCKG